MTDYFDKLFAYLQDPFHIWLLFDLGMCAADDMLMEIINSSKHHFYVRPIWSEDHNLVSIIIFIQNFLSNLDHPITVTIEYENAKNIRPFHRLLTMMDEHPNIFSINMNIFDESYITHFLQGPPHRKIQKLWFYYAPTTKRWKKFCRLWAKHYFYIQELSITGWNSTYKRNKLFSTALSIFDKVVHHNWTLINFSFNTWFTTDCIVKTISRNRNSWITRIVFLEGSRIQIDRDKKSTFLEGDLNHWKKK